MYSRNFARGLTRRQALSAAVTITGRPLPALAPVTHLARFSSAWPASAIEGALIPASEWRHFPRAADRAPWESLPEASRRGCVSDGERGVGPGWESLPATLFLEYVRNGNRSNYQDVRNRRRNRLRELVVAECIEGKGRFCDEIVNGIWLTCEESWWGVPAHMNLQKAGAGLPDTAEPTVDLFAAETASLLAWTSYLLGPQLDGVSKQVRDRISVELERRILSVYERRDDFGWMALAPESAQSVNNWNPWINSNCLTCALLEIAEPKRRAAFVAKVLRSLDPFLNYYAADGGCDEGPGYWGHAGGSLFENLELLYSASRGRMNLFDEPLVGEIGRYIYRSHIAGDYFINFADASAKMAPKADLIFRYGRRIRDARMQEFGAWAAGRQRAAGVHAEADSLARQLSALFNQITIEGARGAPPLLGDVWFPGIQVMAARSRAGSEQGLFLAAQGGHNAESHNHNDVGNFILFASGKPAIIDVGVEEYTSRTFSPRRYEIWTMQSAYHNVPTIGGVMQGAGRRFGATAVGYSANDGRAEFTLDIAGAYPPEAGVRAWVRTLRLSRRENALLLLDYFKLSGASPVELNLMTPGAVDRETPGRLKLAAGVAVDYDAELLESAVDEIPVEDRRLAPVWGSRLYRMRLILRKPSSEGRWEIRFVESA